MNGYLDDGGNDQPYVSVSLNTIPGVFDTYSVMIYMNGDNPPPGMRRSSLKTWTDSVTPGTVITGLVGIPSAPAFTGAFVQAGSCGMTGPPVDATAVEGNYVVFTGTAARNHCIRRTGNGDP